MTGMPAPAAVELAIRDAIRSIERGMGANAAKDAFRLDALDFDFTSKGASFSLAHGMVVLSSWFLCREIELANLRVKHMAVDTSHADAGLEQNRHSGQPGAPQALLLLWCGA